MARESGLPRSFQRDGTHNWLPRWLLPFILAAAATCGVTRQGRVCRSASVQRNTSGDVFRPPCVPGGGCSSKHFRSPFGPERRRLPALGLSVNTPCAARRREGFATTPSLAPVARNLGHWRRSTPRCTRCRYLHPALFIRNHSRAHARSRVISVRLAFAS